MLRVQKYILIPMSTVKWELLISQKNSITFHKLVLQGDLESIYRDHKTDEALDGIFQFHLEPISFIYL